MVNHFATLLANFNFSRPRVGVYSTFLLSDDSGSILTDQESAWLVAEEVNQEYADAFSWISPLVNRQFSPIPLPSQLQRFHDILFPPSASLEYKEFLLYSYLRAVASTDRAQDMLKYDSRITYNLNEIKTYFKTSKVYTPKSNTTDFKLLVSGRLESHEGLESHLNSFIVRQVSNTSNVLIYSPVQNTYYKTGVKESTIPEGMETQVIETTQNISQVFQIADTGLSFVLTGPFSSSGFTDTSNKIWAFSAQAPYNFSLLDKINELYTHESIVDDMLDYARLKTSISYENLWKQHFNSIYKFSGLLLAYVEKVQTLCHLQN